ncbi:hypothetical protein KJ742_04420 [Patescibacteria group bacterium]|nr:hypothetical protein [Patescibacteria group bacterium]MBU1683163.1 hypothetical protein [Patescibacteria group bacterium]MBU1935294.1 hypothetical protein [Patescibacteria group bacterium]
MPPKEVDNVTNETENITRIAERDDCTVEIVDGTRMRLRREGAKGEINELIFAEQRTEGLTTEQLEAFMDEIVRERYMFPIFRHASQEAAATQTDEEVEEVIEELQRDSRSTRFEASENVRRRNLRARRARR